MPLLTGLGIDISDHHVRLAQVGVFGSVGKLVQMELPEGLVVDEKVIESEKVKELLEARLKKEGLSVPVRTTLLVPESRVFSSSFLFPSAKRSVEANHEARDRAEREIPIPFDEAVVAVSRGGRADGQVRTTAYAVERAVYDGLLSVCDPNICRIVAMEANSKALLRLFQRYARAGHKERGPKTLMAIVDVGSAWATVSVYAADGSNLFSRTLSYHPAGEASKAARLPQATVDIIHSTLEEVVIYFQQQKLEISRFVFAGVEAEDERNKKNGAYQPMGEVVTIGSLKKRDVHIFGAAIGAALRSASPLIYQNQHNFIHPNL